MVVVSGFVVESCVVGSSAACVGSILASPETLEGLRLDGGLCKLEAPCCFHFMLVVEPCFQIPIEDVENFAMQVCCT